MGLLDRPQAPQAKQQQTPQQATQQQDSAMFSRVLQAAQKLMYSEKTRPMFLKLLDGNDKIDVASTAAVKVVLTIVDETKGKIDPKLIVPAGVAIVGDILDFIEKTEGAEIGVDETHKAVAMFCEKVQAAIQRGGDSMIAMPEQMQQQQQPQGV